MKFEGKRLLLVAKEAGAGSLLAALATQWCPDPASVVIASPVAAPYFSGLNMAIMSDVISDGDIVALIGERRPDYVVVGCAAGMSVEKRVLTIAQTVAIEVHAFIDHYWNLWQRFADPIDVRPWAFLPDRIHVPAPACARRLIAVGYPQHRVSTFSHPLLGGAGCRRDPALRAQQRRHFDIADSETVALLVSEPLFAPDPVWDWDQAHEEDYRGLLATLLRLSAVSNLRTPLTVLVRCHPAEPANRWLALCESVPGSRWRNGSGITKDVLFSVVDIAFGLNSMLLLEASVAGIPTYSRHTIQTRQDSWLSTIRPEIVELADEPAIEQAIRSISLVVNGE